MYTENSCSVHHDVHTRSVDLTVAHFVNRLSRGPNIIYSLCD